MSNKTEPPQEIFEEHINFRIFNDRRNKIREICGNKKHKYDNESHFIRVAIEKLIREETQ